MKKYFPAYVRVPVFFIAALLALEYAIDSGDQLAFVKYPLVAILLLLILVILIAIEVIFLAIRNVSFQIMTAEEKQHVLAQRALPLTEQEWYKKIVQVLMRSAPIEQEQALLLEHDYDGIKELDNDLPPWWTYLFIGTIIFAGVYMVYFEVLDGDNQETEYAKEVAAANIAIENWKKTAPDLMDEKTVTLLTDPAELAMGKEIYQNNCAACHRADGGGQIGPNLTDNEWILGGGIKNVFHTIVNGGRDGKGMVAWRGTLKPKEIQHVASYVMSLHGTEPKDPKAAEGEPWVDTEIKTASDK